MMELWHGLTAFIDGSYPGTVRSTEVELFIVMAHTFLVYFPVFSFFFQYSFLLEKKNMKERKIVYGKPDAKNYKNPKKGMRETCNTSTQNDFCSQDILFISNNSSSIFTAKKLVTAEDVIQLKRGLVLCWKPGPCYFSWKTSTTEQQVEFPQTSILDRFLLRASSELLQPSPPHQSVPAN